MGFTQFLVLVTAIVFYAALSAVLMQGYGAEHIFGIRISLGAGPT